MTRAICLKCGEGKIGAYSPCPACGYDPASGGDEALAKSVILSDHYLSIADLQFLAKRLRTGQPITFPAAELEKIMALKPSERLKRGCFSTAGPAVVAVSLLATILLGFQSARVRAAAGP
jgi:hypothetical protein